MADLKISALTASTVPLAGTEVLPIVQSSTTKQVSVANLTAGRTVAASNLAIGTGASASGFNTTVAINRSGGGTRGILFQDGGSDQSGLYTDSGATGTLYIFSNGTRPISMSVNGAESVNLDTSNNVKVTAGNLVIGTSGKGIDFSATPGTGTSELLADYEEGTWTPAGVLSSPGSSATSDVVATYTKVGRLVNVVCSFTFTLGTGSGNFSINGLPFAASSALVYTAFAQGCEGVGALTKTVVGYINPSNTNFYLLLQSQGTGAATQLTSGEMAATSTIRISATYAT